MARRGWHRESARHSLAARGVGTKYPRKAQFSYTLYTLQKPRSDIKKLKEFILKKFGGEDFQLDWVLNRDLSKNDVERLFRDGIVRDGKDFILRGKKGSSCHENSERLALADDNIDIYTGLALSDDGMWRVHTWVYDNKKGKFIETTVKREKYFGYKLNEGEREDFIFQNW